MEGIILLGGFTVGGIAIGYMMNHLKESDCPECDCPRHPREIIYDKCLYCWGVEDGKRMEK